MVTPSRIGRGVRLTISRLGLLALQAGCRSVILRGARRAGDRDLRQ